MGDCVYFTKTVILHQTTTTTYLIFLFITMSLKHFIMAVGLHIVLLFGGGMHQLRAQELLHVRVLETGSQMAIPGAIVNDGKHNYTANEVGECRLPYKGASHVTLSARCIGYHEVVARRFAVSNDSLTIYLKIMDNVLGEAEVSTQRKQTSVTQQAVTLDAKTLEESSALSLGQLLEKVPGVSSISSGNSIAKPVIQGMHSSRILLVNNGVRLESQSWGIDHAPEIDHTASSMIEVIKGAESIRYGYGAVGGVVLLNQAALPYGYDYLKVKGKANIGYSTNARGYDGAGTIELGYKQVGARLHAMYQRAGDYTTADYRLNNTGYKNISFSGLMGYQGRRLTATLSGSLYYSRSGIYYGSNLSDLDQLLKRFERGRPEENTIRPFGYTIAPPFQQSQHVTLKADANWTINDKHSLLLMLSYQKNLRQEFENRKVARYSWLPVQDLRLTTYTGEAIWSANWKAGMTTQVGLSNMYQTNYNVPGTKQPAFIPNFAALTMGVFALHKMNVGAWTYSAGVRYDIRGLDVNGYTSLSSFKYYDDFKVYSNFTGNVAAHYQINANLDARFNVGWAWRPPDVNELYAAGLHHGTYWVQGNNTLESERGYKAVLGARYRTPWLAVEPSLFYQQVKNYIYDNIGSGMERFHNHPSGKYPKFVYGQDHARLVGADIVATVVPMEHLSLTAKGEWIFARNLTQDTWLPFMPSDKYALGADYQLSWGKSRVWEAAFSLEGTYVAKQNRFDATKDLVTESPSAYVLLGGSAQASTTLPNGHKVKFILLGENVLNHLYKEYTDRFRYYAHARGAQFTLRMIYTF